MQNNFHLQTIVFNQNLIAITSTKSHISSNEW